MNPAKNIGFFLLVTIIFSSCTSLYQPAFPIVPADHGGLGVQGTLGASKAQLSASYGFKNRWYVTAGSGGAINLLSDYPNFSARPYHALYGIAGGGYNHVFKNNVELGFSAGFGRRKAFSHYNFFYPGNDTLYTTYYRRSYDIDTKSNLFWFQPLLGFRSDKENGFYLVPKITYEAYRSVILKIEPTYSVPRRNFVYTELFAMLRLSGENVNLDIFGGMTLNFFYRNTRASIPYARLDLVAQPFQFGLSVSK
jgi:hypothetical protein